MNVVELTFARHLLLWPAGLIPVNLVFLALAWIAAVGAEPLHRFAPACAGIPSRSTRTSRTASRSPTRCRPTSCARCCRPGWSWRRSAATASSPSRWCRRDRCARPDCPGGCGQDFFLAGYRVFTTFRVPDGRTLRGLRILRSDANRGAMVAGGNLLTHYNYHRCDARIDASADRIAVDGRTRRSTAAISTSPPIWRTRRCPRVRRFAPCAKRRRFAGPLPFTFDYEAETHSIIAINATRTNWQPAPVAVDVRRLSFFDHPAFAAARRSSPRRFMSRTSITAGQRGVRYAARARCADGDRMTRRTCVRSSASTGRSMPSR